jgi:hypothetical protein
MPWHSHLWVYKWIILSPKVLDHIASKSMGSFIIELDLCSQQMESNHSLLNCGFMTLFWHWQSGTSEIQI